MLWIIACILQVLTIVILTRSRFTVSTGELLSIFVPLIWTSIGTCVFSIIYVFRKRKLQWKAGLDSDAETSSRVIHLAFYVLGSTILFIGLSLLYPARNFINQCFSFTDPLLIKSVYDSALIATFGVPCIISALIGGWVLILEIQEK